MPGTTFSKAYCPEASVDLLSGQHTVEVRRGQSGFDQTVDLIFHQGNQGRDDEGQAGQEQGRQLIGQRLAGAGRHYQQGRLSPQETLNRLFLAGAKPVVAKVLL